MLEMPRASNYSMQCSSQRDPDFGVSEKTACAPPPPIPFRVPPSPSASGTFQSAHSSVPMQTVTTVVQHCQGCDRCCWGTPKRWAASARACGAGTAAVRHPLPPEELNVQHLPPPVSGGSKKRCLGSICCLKNLPKNGGGSM